MGMDYTPYREAIAAMYGESFAASEGEADGALIEGLARDLMETTPAQDLDVFFAQEDGRILGAVMWTPLVFDEARVVLTLSPVATAPNAQRQGVAGRLIRESMAAMVKKGADVLCVYGDPTYYARFGFEVIDQAILPAPYPLKMAFGWQAMAADGGVIAPFKGRPSCAPAFQNPDFW